MPIDPKHIVERQGKSFVVFAGLLNEAHIQGLHSIETDLLQIPAEDNGNVAIVKARATMFGDADPPKFFDAIGDASPGNVGPMVKNAIIRMAETRAIARALRFATNIAATALEEIDDDAPAIGGTHAPLPPTRPTAQPNARPPASAQHPKYVPEQTKPPTKAQEAAELDDLPENLRDLTTSAQTAFRTWRDEIAKAPNDTKLEQLHNGLTERLEQHRVPAQVFDALIEVIGQRSAELDKGEANV